MGQILILLAFAATLFSAWNYYAKIKLAAAPQGKKKARSGLQQKKIQLARSGFYAMTALVTLASGYLLYLIFTHQFQYSYVYRYTSRDLSVGLLLSTFWAGQEGSFLLWAWFISLMGLVFLKRAKQYESHAMLFLNVIQGFFLAILLKASPFATMAQIPPDGQGLNPLLQNFWMVIHPPILFLGYAAAAFPVVIALTALAKKDFANWASYAAPWALFTSITLGAGIIIGAFWAYGTLGWGGYWGWDPVENSSLIPWLINIALVHGLIVEKIKGSLKKTNLFFAVIAFGLVLYSTFLTRSGVLADFSVHSFGDLGLHNYLLLFIGTIVGLGMWLFAKRFKEIPSTPIDLSVFNRENALILSMFVFLGSGILTLLGTSFPIFSRLFGPPSNVNLSFYNQVNLPFAIAMTLLLGITPLLKWGNVRNGFLGKLAYSMTLTAVSVAIAFFLEVRSTLILLFVASCAFAVWSNGLVLVQQVRHNWQSIGAPLAHIGVALMFVGVIVSGDLSQEQFLRLSHGTPGVAFGRHFVFEGTQTKANGKDELHIRVFGENSEFLATPRLYATKYNDSMMREPFIKNGWLTDFYISPLERGSSHVSDNVTLDLKKGETKKLGDYEIHFAAFDMHSHGSDGGIKIGANLEVNHGKQNFAITPALVIKGERREAEPVAFPNISGNGTVQPSVRLQGINADDKSIQLAFAGFMDLPKMQPPKEEITLQVSVKPFMNVLWLGTVLLTLGTVISLKRKLANSI